MLPDEAEGLPCRNLARPIRRSGVSGVALAAATPGPGTIAVVLRRDVASGMAGGCAAIAKGAHLHPHRHGGADHASEVES